MKKLLALFWFSLFVLSSCSPSYKVVGTNAQLKNGWKTFPVELCANTSIEELNISRCKLSALPNCFAEFKSLQEINLAGNNFQKFPKVLLKLDRIKKLSFSKNPLAELPDRITQLSSLQELDLWQTNLKELPLSIIEMKNLKVIDVRNTYMKTDDLQWLQEARPDLVVKSSYGCNCD